VRHELVMLPWLGMFDNLQYQVNGQESVVKNMRVLPPSLFDDQIRRPEFHTIFSRPDL
jgi:hypothetical protein